MMNIEEIKKEIVELARMHDAIDEITLGDFKDAVSIELDAEDLIVAFCESNNYMIDGFPTEKRKTLDEEEQDDYFCRERFQLYLDRLAMEKDDVAEIWWFYNNSFWPDWHPKKEDFLSDIKYQIENGQYDCEL